MFELKTLFILGAGASFPYGYPLGQELVENIISQVGNDTILIPTVDKYESVKEFRKNISISDIKDNMEKIYSQLDEVKPSSITYHNGRKDGINYSLTFGDVNINLCEVKISDIKEFSDLQKALKHTDPLSIDTFLRDNPSHAIAGKTMIIYVLLKFESKKRFTHKGTGDNWYRHLTNDIVSACSNNPEDLLKNNVRIITFNYDLSLEYYIQDQFSRIESFNAKGESENSIASSFVDEFVITHVYGSLYDKKLISHYGEYYGNQNILKLNDSVVNDGLYMNFKRFVASFNTHTNIKTIFDERQVITEFEDLLLWAKDIIFIGFGFDRDNLSKIGFPYTRGDIMRKLQNKKIRYLNFKGNMRSLDRDLERLFTMEYALNPEDLICSHANSISDAYVNDFKKYILTESQANITMGP